MNAALATLASLVFAYLLGSVPFGLLIARWFGKVDIRTVGSGNIGATNVGRVLGFRFFVVVFLLDFLKGFLPTLDLPELARRATGQELPHLPVGVAVAAILGHNFPVFLKFRGGKGVATSLGAVFALDAFASVAAATGFVSCLIVTRFVSMSSIMGGVFWLLVHFTRVQHPWSRDQIAMTIASIGLMGLLVARHRKNIVRIWDGTEPRVNFRRKKGGDRPSGRISTGLVVVLAVVAVGLGGAGFAINASRTFSVEAGPYHVTEVARVATGHQRAERLTFADHGRLLAATCPRYGRVMLYRVTGADALELARDIELDGRPVALWPTADRIYVLVRPNNDARHVEEGWWESFDLSGNAAGPRVRVGMYPDDLAISADGRRALVLTSGRGEGGDHRPMPSLSVYDIASDPETPQVVGRLDFDRPGDDPARLAVSPDGTRAGVSLQGSNAIAWVDLAEIDRPKLISRSAWPGPSSPDALRFDHLGGLLAADEGNESLWHQSRPGAEPDIRPIEGGIGDVVEVPGEPNFRAVTLPFGSGIALLAAGSEPGEPLARLPLKGRANLASTRPLGLAYDPDRALIAVANRSGGSIHLIALRKGGPAR